MTTNDDAALLRWWVAMPLGPEPSGRRLRLTREEGVQLSAHAGPIHVRFADTIRGGERELELSFPKLSAFSLDAVLDQMPDLRDIQRFASELDDEHATAAVLREVLGEGPLLARLLDTPALQSAAESGSGVSVDDVLRSSDHAATTKASRAVDSFIRTMKTSSRVRRSKKTRDIRDAIEAEVFGMARAALASPSVAALESSWRGLEMLLARCPAKAGIAVELVDVAPEGVAALFTDATAEGETGVDAIFVPTPIDDLALLGRIAEAAELALIPAVVELAPTVFDADVHSLPELLSVEPGKVSRTDWLALRQEESSRWLCAVVNRPLVAYEGAAAAAREVMASGVWAVAAMLSESFRTTGGFARIVGPHGALTAPAARVLREGPHEGTAAPTAAFYPVRSQTQLSKHGLVALGSVRDRATIVLSSVPMLRASADAAGLPAQIVTGRIVRFSRWVRDQLPPDSDDATVKAVFAEAGRVFLFPGLGEAAHLDARVVTDGDETMMTVHAIVHPAIAGTLVDIEFPMPFASA